MCFACRQLICFIQFTVNAPLARLREIVRANQRPIICRRAARQSIARLIRLRSRLHPPPGSEDFASTILLAENCFTKMIAICFNCQCSEKTNVKKTTKIKFCGFGCCHNETGNFNSRQC